MTVSHPWLLAGLAAAFVPWWLHRALPPAPTRHPFGAWALLPTLVARPRPRRLAPWPLWLARTVLLVLWAVALARPVAPQAAAQGPISAAHLAVVVDASLSMGALAAGRPLIEAAAARAAMVAREHARVHQTPVVAVVAGEQPRPLTPAGGASAVDAAAVLARLGAGDLGGRGDLAAALRLALSQVARPEAGGPVDVRVVICSDCAGHALAPLVAAGPPDASGLGRVRVELVEAAGHRGRTPPANLALEGVTIHPDPREPALWGLRAKVRNFGPRPVPAAALELRRGGHPLATTTVAVAAGGVAEQALTHRLVQAEEVLTIALAAGADNVLAADDQVPVLLRRDRPVRLLAVDGEPKEASWADELFFVEAALAAGRGEGMGLAVEVRTLAELAAGEDWSRGALAPEVVLLANPPALPARARERLRGFVAGGGGLLVTLGSQATSEAVNGDFAGLLPRRLREVREAAGGPASPSVAAVARDHPAWQGLGEDVAAQLAASRTWRWFDLEPTGAEGDQTILALEGGAPLLVAARRPPAGPRMLWTSSIDSAWSDVVLQPAFVPLLGAAVRYLAGRPPAGPPAMVRQGERAARAAPRPLRWQPPDDGPAVVAQAQGERWVTPPLTILGRYAAEALEGGDWRRAAGDDVLVWPRLDESDLTPAASNALDAWSTSPAAQVVVAGRGREARAAPTPLTAIALALVAATAALEGALAGRRR